MIDFTDNQSIRAYLFSKMNNSNEEKIFLMLWNRLDEAEQRIMRLMSLEGKVKDHQEYIDAQNLEEEMDD